jgi:flavin-dependent dehydrogenase
VGAVDLFVVGGGPAGLAVAIAARRRGLTVVLADSATPPVDKACGEGLMPDSLDALADLGVKVAGFPFRGIRYLGGGAVVEAQFPSGPGLGVRRTDLHQTMAGRAEALGVRLMWGARVEGLTEGGVRAGGQTVPCRWVAGADGCHSRVRRWAGLDRARGRETLRFGFRRHYPMAPWTDFVEVYWGRDCQIYVTPVAPDRVCITLISANPRLRLEAVLSEFPELRERLAGAKPETSDRGALTVTRQLKAVWRGNVALVGDASGSVDAITGEGMSLLFRQAEVLAPALVSGDLARYGQEHRKLAWRPGFMAGLLLALGSRDRLRGRALRGLAADPDVFATILSVHVGAMAPVRLLPAGLALGWRMLAA